MAIAKKIEFDQATLQAAELAKALSHPARIMILRLLSQQTDCMVGNLVDKLPLSQSTVSQHLKELKRVGLIQGEVDGPKVCYCINDKTLKKLMRAFEKIVNPIVKQCC